MTPYLNFLYFLLLLYPTAPALLLGFTGWLRPWYLLVATLAMILLQYGGAFGGTDRQLLWLGAFAVYATAIVYGFAVLRRRRRRRAAFTAAIVLILLPLIAVKVQPVLASHDWLPAWAVPAAAASPAHAPSSETSAAPPASAPAAVSRPPASPAAASTLQAILGTTVGFLGISYLTFRYLDVLVGLQDGLFSVPGPGLLLTYVFFFPCISSGPIDRFRRFARDAAQFRRARDYAADVDAGLYRLAQGFLYKFVLADLIDRWWLGPLTPLRDPLHMWLYMYAYTLFLFFDFAGYTAFAIGVGCFFGIRSPENFDAPFLARNFKDFWNRWFITLSQFLRDHVYMRFVLGATRRRWFGNNRHAASYLGYMLTFLAMGFWHGLALQYIVYGGYHGVMISLNDFLARWNRRRALIPDTRFTRGLSVFATFHLVCFGMLIFSGHLFT